MADTVLPYYTEALVSWLLAANKLSLPETKPQVPWMMQYPNLSPADWVHVLSRQNTCLSPTKTSHSDSYCDGEDQDKALDLSVKACSAVDTISANGSNLFVSYINSLNESIRSKGKD